MDLITFRCHACGQGLKMPAQHAGRKVKCTKCGAVLTVPAASQAEAAPAPPAHQKKSLLDDDDDGVTTYGVEGHEAAAAAAAKAKEEAERERQRRKRREEEDEEEEDEEDREAREEEAEALRRRLEGDDEEDEDDYDDEDRPKKKRRPRAKLDVNAFQRVRVGIMVALVAICFLAGSLLLHKIVILIGLTAGNHYSETLQEVHPHYGKKGDETKDVDMMELMIKLVGGMKAYDANKVLLIMSHVFALLQGAVMIAACIFCLPVPPRFGAKGVVVTALVIAAINVIVVMVFRILPVVGAIKLVLVPYFGVELAMSEANIGRFMPIHILWSGSPYIQALLTILVLALGYGELVLFPVFLRLVAIQLKSEKLETSSGGLIQLSLAQVFIQVAFQLMAMTGSSEVLSIVLKVVYILGLCFYVWQLTWYIVLLISSRRIIQDAIDKELKSE